MLEIYQVTDARHGTRSAYNEIYALYGLRQLDSFYEWLLAILRPLGQRRLLDVACGVGELANRAASRAVKAHGIDHSTVALATAQKQGGASFACADGQILPFADATFDYVTNIGSLEHFDNVLLGALEMRRVLTPSGVAMILVPNTYSILHNVWSAFRTGRTGQDDQPIQRYAARLEWQDVLEQAGFRVENTFKYEQVMPHGWTEVRWFLRHPKDLARLFLTPFIPVDWAACFVFICHPVAGKRDGPERR